MEQCDRLSSCLFFANRLANMPGTSELIKRKYCRGTYWTCARRIVVLAKGADKVPADLARGHVKFSICGQQKYPLPVQD